MASLRKRLQKRSTFANTKGTAGDGDSPSASSSSSREDIRVTLTPEPKVEGPVAPDDLKSTPPPPPPKHESSLAPSQSLLDRYKKHSAKIPSAALTEKPPTVQSLKAARSSAFSEDCGNVLPRGFPQPVGAQTALELEDTKATRKFEGVEFEMLRTRSKVGEAPTPAVVEHSATYEPRQTRSQTRRQQRIDSFDASIKIANATSPITDVPRPLLVQAARSENTSPRSPSPRALPMTLGNFIGDFTAATPKNRPNKPQAQEFAEPQQSPTSMSATDPIFSYMPRVLPLRTKMAPVPYKEDGNVLAVAVKPAVWNPEIHSAFVWVSPLASTSLSTEPWAPGKRWTCCQCRRLDPRGLAARTIVEQRVCSRLECGHVRCGTGCAIMLEQSLAGY